MAWVVFAVNSLLGLATLFGAPAPQGLGPWEAALAGGVALALAVLLLARLSGVLTARSPEQLVPVLLLPAVGIPVLVSAIVGVANGVPLGAAVRATAPYVVFLPVILLGLVLGGRPRFWVITIPLVVTGVLQSVYLLGLFLTTVPDATDVGSVWILRITLLDARTTLPLLLGAATLPLAWGERASRPVLRLLCWAPAALALTAALSTQTRSQVLAVLVGIGSYIIMSGVLRLRRTGRPWTAIAQRVGAGLAAAVMAIAILAVTIPHTRALLQAVVLRSQTELDTGRWRDEWEPALDAVLDRGIPGVALGIGSGESFVTAAGEERTYVHNLLLYGLVYFGGLGLGIILLSYIVLFLGLLRRAAQTEDPRYLALAAMVAAMFVFAQFFAVHKLFSYNLMLALAAQALAQSAGSQRESA